MMIEKVAGALDAKGVEFAVVGGYAVALHGALRGTLDLDLLLRLRRKDFEDAEAALAGIGFLPRLPASAAEVLAFREELVRRRGVHSWGFHRPDEPGALVDIVLTDDLAGKRVRRLRAGRLSLPIVEKDELIRMKEAAGRPQDLEDVRALRGIRA
ncbi:MAG: hypothetical protein WC969_09700 [Elusimicrobiota bacterium]|jgi:hypothetical protein